ncbi:MAG TPA: hypothetical protein VI754_08820 [Bacteriovoracaceae bacterium]|nr:hypothetical protein [Bacteriovoracaceae bacterium]
MKKIILCLALVIMSVSVYAKTDYVCESQDGSRAFLTLDNKFKTLSWQDYKTSAKSRGVFSHIEMSRYSPFKGMQIFRLEDFAITNDSAYMLAVVDDMKRAKEITVFEYLDNDDHEEDVTQFSCSL